MRGNKIGFVILALGTALAFSACNEILHATKGTARVLGHVGSQMLLSSGKIKQTTETTTLELGDWHTLNVQNEIGEIRLVTGTKTPSLTITKRFNKPENLLLTLETRGGTLNIVGKIKQNTCHNCSIDLTLNVPENLEIQLQTDVGDMDIAGSLRSLDARTDLGNISAKDLGKSQVLMQSDTGDLTLSNVEGAVVLETNLGAISVNTIRGTLNLTTDTGNVTAKNITLEPGSSNQLRTSIGRLTLEDFRALDGIKLEGQTNIGDLELDLSGFLVKQNSEWMEQQFTASRAGQHPANVDFQNDTGTIVARVR